MKDLKLSSRKRKRDTFYDIICFPFRILGDILEAIFD